MVNRNVINFKIKETKLETKLCVVWLLNKSREKTELNALTDKALAVFRISLSVI